MKTTQAQQPTHPPMKAKNLNINSLKWNAIIAILRADEKLIGTESYMGVAWFWNKEYKHYLRGDIKPITYCTRRRVHNALLNAGLAVDGCSDQHLAIITRFTGCR